MDLGDLLDIGLRRYRGNKKSDFLALVHFEGVSVLAFLGGESLFLNATPYDMFMPTAWIPLQPPDS